MKTRCRQITTLLAIIAVGAMLAMGTGGEKRETFIETASTLYGQAILDAAEPLGEIDSLTVDAVVQQHAGFTVINQSELAVMWRGELFTGDPPCFSPHGPADLMLAVPGLFLTSCGSTVTPQITTPAGESDTVEHTIGAERLDHEIGEFALSEWEDGATIELSSAPGAFAQVTISGARGPFVLDSRDGLVHIVDLGDGRGSSVIVMMHDLTIDAQIAGDYVPAR